jgi:FkbH-like protein
LAEVKAAHPDIECLAFPGGEDYRAAYQLLEDLRDLFGKQSVSEEDQIRLESIRASQSAVRTPESKGGTAEQFLQELSGELTLWFSGNPPHPRALELINKTNQFNLNGKRHTEVSWKDYLNDPKRFLLLASYQDKFGPLGNIAVIAGRHEGSELSVNHWVMSCRAFSRRIEHGCLLHLFLKLGAEQASFDFVPTPRNGPLQDFFAELIGYAPATTFSISRQQLRDRCPPVFFHIQERSNE